MTDRPFEVVAEIALQGLPTSGDIARIGDQVERARQGAPAVVRATLTPPARFRDGNYCLETRCAVWAADGAAAVAAVEELLRQAGLTARSVHLSGRALTPAEVPPPPAQGAGAKPTARARRPAASAQGSARGASAAAQATPTRARGRARSARGAASRGKASGTRRRGR
ncbi:MAG: hypothetical protein K6W08_03915 [Firmicutes bacterium]|nr:hypothetical protein [Bacillota bacterium]